MIPVQDDTGPMSPAAGVINGCSSDMTSLFFGMKSLLEFYSQLLMPSMVQNWSKEVKKIEEPRSHHQAVTISCEGFIQARAVSVEQLEMSNFSCFLPSTISTVITNC